MTHNSEARKGVGQTLRHLRHLSSAGFYGTLEVRFEAGHVVHLTEHRNLKPNSLETPETLESIHAKFITRN